MNRKLKPLIWWIRLLRFAKQHHSREAPIAFIESHGATPPGILTFTVFASMSPGPRCARHGPLRSTRKTWSALRRARTPAHRYDPRRTTAAHCKLIPFLHVAPSRARQSLSVLFAIALSLGSHFSEPSCSIEATGPGSSGRSRNADSRH